MRAFTMKIDEAFDRVLSELSRTTGKSKSQVVKDAVYLYRESLKRQKVLERMKQIAHELKNDPRVLEDIKELEGTLSEEAPLFVFGMRDLY